MGTRNLTAVMVGGKYKIAQYGQWDGNPGGQGVEALGFMRGVDLEKFKAALAETRFLSTEEMKEIDAKYGSDWINHYPHLSRDHGAKILGMVLKGAKELKNSIGFAGDSLFCEYAYIIDLDKGTFEVYEGFNHGPVTEGRFISGDESLENTDGYGPVKLVKTYQLDNLPTDDVFIEELTPDDEED